MASSLLVILIAIATWMDNSALLGSCLEYHPYDGWYNNYAHPDWGGAETQLLRQVAPAYSDGTYEPAGADRPSPFNVSRVVFSGPTGFPSFRNRTAFLVFFGQQVVEEIMDAQRPGCPPEYMLLNIPEEHQHFSNDSDAVNVMPLPRSRYDQRTGFSPSNPRQQLNEASAWIDGTLTYGPNRAWTDAIREFKDGLLQIDDVLGPEPYRGEFPRNNTMRLPFINPAPPVDHPQLKPISRLNKLGNPRGFENPALLTMGVLWFRYHNVWARRLKQQNPDWEDEKLFNEARKMVIAVHQKIVVEDWLSIWLSNGTSSVLPEYTGYNPWIHPGIAHVFQSSALRFGHTMVTPGIYRRSGDCTYRTTSERTGKPGKVALRTCNTYFNSQDAVYEQDIDELIMGLSSQIAEREDNIITPDLRGDVFGPLEFNRRDLMAINIQRGRDNGVPDYNTVRQAYGLKANTWDDIIQDGSEIDKSIIDKIKPMYDNDIGKLDLWVGGMLETNKEPGEVFQAITKDQFRRIRDGDRFWYENKLNGLYTDAEVQLIKNITIKTVIMETTTIKDTEIQDDPFVFNGDPCPPPEQLNHSSSNVDECTPKKTFDYFSGSQISYIVSVIALFIPEFVFVGVLFLLAKKHDKEVAQMQAKTRQHNRSANKGSASKFSVSEWQGPKQKWHNITVKLEPAKKHIFVHDGANKLIRTIDFNIMVRQGVKQMETYLSVDKSMDMLIVKIPKEYDLVLRFDTVGERQDFQDSFRDFLNGEPGLASPQGISTKNMFMAAVTKENRKHQLERFFKAVFANVAKDDHGNIGGGLLQDGEGLKSELTKHEFAEALGLRPSSTFVESMFKMVDNDNSGTVSFREFVDLVVVFFKGSADDKMKLLFKMYDVNNTGTLSRSEFKNMLKSLIELSSTQVEDDNIDTLIQGLCDRAGINNKNELKFKDFTKVLEDYQQDLDHATIDLSLDGMKMPDNIRRENAPMKARKSLKQAYPIIMRNCIENLFMSDFHVGFRAFIKRIKDISNFNRNNRMTKIPEAQIKTIHRQFPETETKKKLSQFKRYVENYKRQIFWVTLYTLVTIGVFAERAYFYSVEREQGGLRRIAGDGVTVTRGAASAMMFTYSSLLVTMCRNIITALRETFLNRYVPFDAAVDFHKYIAGLALFFTVMHIIGHCINFYHISTQTAGDLNCLFSNFFHATDVLPKFHDWLWLTLTGFTGVLLTVHACLIYTFAIQFARRHSFRSFWITHNSYILFFVLMILHGMGRLVQAPFLHYFLLGPAVLFTIDQLISVSRKTVEIAVVKAELLPSDVTFLEFKKPQSFDYKSGQWVRIACTVQGKSEYHPFTLSSAPHEENLSLHIRAVGPWTYNLRSTYSPETVKEHSWPKILLDGPYGEGHQDWYKFDVSVLVGGGIGVTPFISILKDIAYRSKTGGQIACKKIYFIWVTRTQKQFEWVTDIIRDVEEADRKNLVDVHIFVTEFKQKFDIRTTMLYICEKYFQKFSGRSLFTGLQSITHFGRPDFGSFFRQLTIEHAETTLFGVFSCGPPPMTNNVEKAVRKLNNTDTDALFVHHYENF